jgi:hypothetical protein
VYVHRRRPVANTPSYIQYNWVVVNEAWVEEKKNAPGRDFTKFSGGENGGNVHTVDWPKVLNYNTYCASTLYRFQSLNSVADKDLFGRICIFQTG